jgi:uncharacterized membrane protein YciS (DUF1049 family)
MIAQTLNTLVSEVSGLWSWIIGIIAGWGLTFTAVVAALVYAHVRITRLKKIVGKIENQLVTDVRDLSLRLRKLEK